MDEAEYDILYGSGAFQRDFGNPAVGEAMQIVAKAHYGEFTPLSELDQG